MELGIESYKDFFELLVSTIGVTAILIAASSYFMNRKQHYFNVINNCVNKFQNNFAGLEKFDKKETIKYLDLVSEELFYMKETYIPFAISVEWIDGMLDYLPLIIDNKQIFPYSKTPIEKNLPENLFNLYPRIRKVFSITSNNIEILKENSKIDLTAKQHIKLRKKIVIELMTNLFSNKRKKKIIRKTVKILDSFYS